MFKSIVSSTNFHKLCVLLIVQQYAENQKAKKKIWPNFKKAE